MQDTPDINSVFYTTPIPDNLSSCHGIEFWDYEKNKRLKPENVPWKYRQNVFFKCKMGESKFAHHSCWLTRQGEPVQEYKNYCPFLFFCKDDCDVQHHYLYDCFYKEKNLVEQEDIINLRQFLSCSTFTKEYITTRLQADCSLKFVRIFDYIFIRHYTIGTITTCHFECVIKWASSVEDLELIKKLYIKYEPVYILIDAKNFDKTTAQREAFIDYFQWLFNRETEKEYYQNSARLFENCLLNIIADKTITKEFVAKSLSLIDNNIGLFRNDESFVNHLKSLMK